MSDRVMNGESGESIKLPVMGRGELEYEKLVRG